MRDVAGLNYRCIHRGSSTNHHKQHSLERTLTSYRIDTPQAAMSERLYAKGGGHQPISGQKAWVTCALQVCKSCDIRKDYIHCSVDTLATSLQKSGNSSVSGRMMRRRAAIAAQLGVCIGAVSEIGTASAGKGGYTKASEHDLFLRASVQLWVRLGLRRSTVKKESSKW